MTAYEFLSQAYRLDQRIDAKIDQIASLNELATKCTSTLSGMPHAPSRTPSPMEDAICKIIDLQNEIHKDMDKLVDLKREIVSVIKAVESPDYQLILEKRYLLYLTWEQIAVDMGYELRYIHKLHSRALDMCVIPKQYEKIA